jgi:hypothetical protein
MTSDDLKQIFAAYGSVVSANVVVDKYTNRSKGFGFVEFSTEEELKLLWLWMVPSKVVEISPLKKLCLALKDHKHKLFML